MERNRFPRFNSLLLLLTILITGNGCVRNPSLFLGAMKGDLVKVEKSLETNANVNAKDTWGVTPLHYALMNGHKEVAELLVARGADLRLREDFGGFFPLHWAAEKGYIDMVKSSLDNEVDVNATSNLGHTPLYMALQYQQYEVVRFLVDMGADVNLKPYEAKSFPLLYPISNGRRDIVKLMLDHGAEVNAKTPEGITALELAKRKGYDEIVDLLLRSGARE